MTTDPRIDRRALLGAGAAAALACTSVGKASTEPAGESPPAPRDGLPLMVGSANALAGMKLQWQALKDGADPLDAAIEVVKVAEADPRDSSVGLGGLPDEDGRVTLDAACMHGPTHNAGAVGCIQNILHPCEVARLVMERTDHVYLMGEGAYRFARQHGHPHVELLTPKAREQWLRWKESMSERDDRLPPPPERDRRSGALTEEPGERVASSRRAFLERRQTGTIHCSALSTLGELACTTTTSGLSWKIPGRVGDSPIIGAGLYCDQEAGSAGSTGRGEAAILSNGSFAIVELLRQGASPLEAGLEALRRVMRQCERQASWQPELMGEDGKPAFNINFYILSKDGEYAGVRLSGGGSFAVAGPEEGPRHERVVALLE